MVITKTISGLHFTVRMGVVAVYSILEEFGLAATLTIVGLGVGVMILSFLMFSSVFGWIFGHGTLIATIFWVSMYLIGGYKVGDLISLHPKKCEST